MSGVEIVLALMIGLVAGSFSGLLGVGGGSIMVPAMVLLLGQTQHVAEGTSLVVIVPTALAGAWAAGRRGLLDSRVAALLAAAGVVGAVGGAVVAVHVISDEAILRRLFGIFVLIVAARMLASVRRSGRPAGPPAR